LNSIAQYGQPKEPSRDYLPLFVQSRQSMNVSSNTIKLYRFILERFLQQVDAEKTNSQHIERYLLNIPANGISLGNRHAHYRTLKTFFFWLEQNYRIPCPMRNVRASKLPKMILPSLTLNQVLELIDKAGNTRNQAIIALAVESGLRVYELAQIKTEDIDWQNRIIKVLGKGRKEAYAPFGELSEKYLRE
jgi:site-specific recombinase XerD